VKWFGAPAYEEKSAPLVIVLDLTCCQQVPSLYAARSVDGCFDFVVSIL
jgi:hypothetical protein